MRYPTSIVLSFLIVFCHPAAYSQTDIFMRDSDISEHALIEALRPTTPVLSANLLDAADSPATNTMATRRMRSIRITKDEQKPQRSHVPTTKTAAASLLITFETNSATLTLRAKQSLDVVARALKSEGLSPFRFSIEGHADPRGNESDNLELSRLRAESVALYLSGQHQIESDRLSTVGKGQSEMVNLLQTDAPENRRVTIKTLVQ